jgi:hypothetical protein
MHWAKENGQKDKQCSALAREFTLGCLLGLVVQS